MRQPADAYEYKPAIKNEFKNSRSWFIILSKSSDYWLGMARYNNFGFGTIPECNTSLPIPEVTNNQPKKISELEKSECSSYTVLINPG